jgi:hypothetical protein
LVEQAFLPMLAVAKAAIEPPVAGDAEADGARTVNAAGRVRAAAREMMHGRSRRMREDVLLRRALRPVHRSGTRLT